MTTHSLGRLSRSVCAGLFAVVIAAGCSDQQPPSPSGSGGDVGTVTPSPLCGATPDMASGSGGFAGGPTPGGFFSPFPPQYGATVAAPTPPPAISGGTLRILADGHTAVAADPDRDQVYIVDLSTKSVRATVALNAGDEPGRVVADVAGRAHVALRHGGALVSIDTLSGQILQRRAVCAAPRGVAYDSATDLVHVACSGGELVSLPAAGGSAVRTLNLAQDLRDVVVDGSRLRVSRFLSAEVLTVNADGSVPEPVKLPTFRATAARGGQRYTPGVAWRMAEMPDGSGVMMLHQRGVDEEVQPVVGGYGGPDACSGIVHPAVTMVSADGSTRSGPAMAGLTLAVDMAISPDGQRVAFVSAGNSTNQNLITGGSTPGLTQVFVSDTDSVTDDVVGCMPDGTHGPCNSGVGGTPLPTGSAGATGSMPSKGGATCGLPDPSVPQVVGQPIAVAFDGAGQVIVQSREPAMLALPALASARSSRTTTAPTGTSPRSPASAAAASATVIQRRSRAVARDRRDDRSAATSSPRYQPGPSSCRRQGEWSAQPPSSGSGSPEAKRPPPRPARRIPSRPMSRCWVSRGWSATPSPAR